MRSVVALAVLLVANSARAEQITVPFTFSSQENVKSKWDGDSWILTSPPTDVPTIPGHLDQIQINAKLTYTIGIQARADLPDFFKPFVYSEITFQTYEPHTVPLWFGSAEFITEWQGMTLPPGASWTSPPQSANYQITLQPIDLQLLKTHGQWAPIIATTSQGMTSFDGTVTGSITYFYTIPEPTTWTMLVVGACVGFFIYRKN